MMIISRFMKSALFIILLLSLISTAKADPDIAIQIGKNLHSDYLLDLEEDWLSKFQSTIENIDETLNKNDEFISKTSEGIQEFSENRLAKLLEQGKVKQAYSESIFYGVVLSGIVLTDTVIPNDTREGTVDVGAMVLTSGTIKGLKVVAKLPVTKKIADDLFRLIAKGSNKDAERIGAIITEKNAKFGNNGKTPGIRELEFDTHQAALDAAEDDFSKLIGKHSKEANYAGYKGEKAVALPDGGMVGIRTFSTNSPRTSVTIDLNVKGLIVDGAEVKKIKYNVK
jgi:hypothetical protein